MPKAKQGAEPRVAKVWHIDWPSIGLQIPGITLQFNSMRFKAVLPLVFTLTALWLSPVAAQTPEDHFKQGIAAFQNGDIEKARTAFHESLKQDGDNPVILFNLGLTEQRAGKNGLALGLWRKALAVDPSYTPARSAIGWTQGKLERSDIPRKMELWETLRNAALEPVAIDKYLLATAILLLASGWLTLRYFGSRRRALLEEKPLPPLPWVAILTSLLFFASGFLSLAKAYDLQSVRGTIVEKKIEAKSTPEPSGTPLFELYEGLEVIIRAATEDYLQVTYPGGPTGWIPKTAVLTTADKVVP